MDISENKASRGMSLAQFAGCLDHLANRLMRTMAISDRNYLARGLITLPQLWALDQVAARQKCAMRVLAQALGLKSSTVTGLVDRLVKLGLLNRSSSPEDRRIVLAQITPKGRRILKHLRAERHKTIVNLFQHVSQKERAAYLEIIEKILRAASAGRVRASGNLQD